MFDLITLPADCQPYTDAPAEFEPTGPTAADAEWWAENSPANAVDFDVVESAADLENRALEAAYQDHLWALGY